MPVQIAVGISDSFDAVEAFSDAALDAVRGLDAPCDLCLVFAGTPHLGHAKWVLSAVHERLEPRNLIGCGAGGVVGPGREIEGGAGAVVWAASLPGAEITTHHLTAEPGAEPGDISGLPVPEEMGESMFLLADPYSFAADACLARINEDRPGMPVLGGLASAAIAGSSALFRDGDVLGAGAVACSLSGVEVLPCVSQGAAPVGPEMTITAAKGNVIEQLASKPALERIGEVIAGLPRSERELVAAALMLGIVIDESKPNYERGDFLVRPLIGADKESGAVAIGERVRVGQVVRLHARDGAAADEDLREALREQSDEFGAGGAAGALLFTCNGRGSHMFDVSDHDANAIDDALGVPAGGFFCAGEIGPVGGRNFLHGFTATMALFRR
jgi:small ligand-binding sensory domain FIST